MDEQARKRLKDDINTEIGDEEGEKKMKGGRGGKKAKGRNISGMYQLCYFFDTVQSVLNNFTGKQAWTKHKKR